MMETIKLNNGIECPVIGIGTFMLAPADAQNSVREALKMGYSLVDTANAYVNERAVGRGIKESGLDKLIKASYSLLGLISYLTAGPKEVRAWTITKGTKAPQAAGKVHSDMERGFIRAEVVSYNDLVKFGSMQAVKENGLLRSEGKEYVFQDGDIAYFRFNV